MELTKTEVEVIAAAVEQATGASLRELNDLQLAAVAGGIGDTVL